MRSVNLIGALPLIPSAMSQSRPVPINRRGVLRYVAGASLAAGFTSAPVSRALAFGQSSVDPAAMAATGPAKDEWQEIANSDDFFPDVESKDELLTEVEPPAEDAADDVGDSDGETQAVVLPAERRLHLVNDHTRERLEITYVTRDLYIDESLESIAHLMRDHRAEEQRDMDIALLDTLFLLQQRLDVDEPLHILSGYRTPATNAALRKRSSGVARHSLHMEGKAADIHVPGIKTSDLRSAALGLHAGGVGYYRNSGFVHVDTGVVRSWRG